MIGDSFNEIYNFLYNKFIDNNSEEPIDEPINKEDDLEIITNALKTKKVRFDPMSDGRIFVSFEVIENGVEYFHSILISNNNDNYLLKDEIQWFDASSRKTITTHEEKEFDDARHLAQFILLEL